MSLTDWTAYNARKTRPREPVREKSPSAPVPSKDEPMEVNEQSLSDTAITRIRQWIVGKNT